MTRKNFEASPYFSKGLYDGPDAYNVEVDINDGALCVKKGAKYFSVTTPMELVIVMIKEKGKLKILLASYIDD
jgi:hypothetical protein